jgi:preprotein translocase subunit SecG
MILAATDWLTISINLLLVLFVIICVVMTLMILMQRPKQEGLGAAFGGGMTDQMFGARTTNVLQRGTVWFASLFFVLALTLAVLIGMKNSRNESLITAEKAEESETETATEAPLQPSQDALETLRSLLEEAETIEDVPVEVVPEDESTPEDVVEEESGEETSSEEENSEER